MTTCFVMFLFKVGRLNNLHPRCSTVSIPSPFKAEKIEPLHQMTNAEFGPIRGKLSLKIYEYKNEILFHFETVSPGAILDFILRSLPARDFLKLI